MNYLECAARLTFELGVCRDVREPCGPRQGSDGRRRTRDHAGCAQKRAGFEELYAKRSVSTSLKLRVAHRRASLKLGFGGENRRDFVPRLNVHPQGVIDPINECRPA